MISVKEWKIRIVRYFLANNEGIYVYKMENEQTMFKYFASNFDQNAQIAYNELNTEGIIKRIKEDGKYYYILNFGEKAHEIDAIITKRPLEERAEIIRPTDNEFKNLRKEFTDVSTRDQPNRGYYYFCTKIDDPSYWIVLIRTKPNVKPYKIILGSDKANDSKIGEIWNAVLEVSKTNNKRRFIRKDVEDIAPKACGNNRLASRSAFKIFVHLKWLEAVSKKGNTIYYQVVKKDAGI